MEYVDLKWLAILGGAALWTIVFSMSSNPPVRGWRNLGILACYVLGVAMVFFTTWRAFLGNWAIFGLGSGLLYFLYEAFSHIRGRAEGASKPSPMTILNGIIAWPIMLPEAIEYLLADLGILKSPSSSDGAQT